MRVRVWALIRELLWMTRPLNSAMTGLGVVFALLVYSGYGLPRISLIMIGFLTGFLASASSMLVNDYVDRGVDAVNKPYKPIPSGRVDPQTALWLSITALIIAVAINVFASLPALATASIYAVVGYAYSFMRRYWWSHFLVSFSTTGPIVYGYILSGSPTSKLLFTILFSATIFLINTGREVLKAIMDVEGDRRYGYSTIPIRFGVENAGRAMILIGLTGSILGIVAGILGCAGPGYLILIILAALVYMHGLYRAYRRITDRGVLEWSRRTTIYGMLIGLLAFLASGI